ncbi:MAG: PAS domain S-box protein [Acidobacteriota bacterium]
MADASDSPFGQGTGLPLGVLVVENDEADFRLAERTLRERWGAARCLRVDRREALAQALKTGAWDVVLLGSAAPGLEFRECMDILRSSDPGLPVILATGPIGEERTVELLKLGVWDLVLKDRLYRLPSAVERGLREAAERRALGKAQADALDHQEKLRAIADFTYDWEYWRAVDGSIAWMSPSCERITGRSPGEFIADVSLLKSIIHPDDASLYSGHAHAASADPHRTYDIDFRIIHASGRTVWINHRCSDVFNQNGAFVGRRTSNRDITDRKLAEDELVRQTTLLSTIINAIPDMVFIKDPQGVYLECNQAVRDVVGKPREEIVGRTDYDLFQRDLADFFREQDRTMLETGKPRQNDEWITYPDGGRALLETIKVPLFDPAGKPVGLLGVSRDITARKQAEEALKQNEEALRAILLGIKAGIIVSDPSTMSILDINSVAEEILGMSREEAIGTPCSRIRWQGEAPSDSFESCDFTPGGSNSTEVRLTRPDGRIVPVTRTVVSARSGGKQLSYEIIFDLTQRKTLERQLAIAQRLESIGALASGIAHEINTPIQYIGDNLAFLSDAFASLEAALRQCAGPQDTSSRDKRAQELEFLLREAPEALSQSRDGVARVTTIVQAMKRFAHPGSEEKTPLDVNKAIENTVEVARNEWKYHADVLLQLDPGLEFFHCFAGDFNQVMLNLLVNAAHAVNDKYKDRSGKGSIRISTEMKDHTLLVSVADDGCGIPPENLTRIYDPFFTTKEVGKGSGQGLAIVHDIVVNKHGGSIDVESDPGTGTVFTLRFPLAVGAKATK